MKQSSSASVFGVCIFLAGIVGIVFGGTLHHGFVNFDDDTYVYENRMVQGGLTAEGVRRAFTQVHASNWHPLTTLSHMADCQLYGLDAGGHHLTNVLLHGLTAVLLFLVLRQLTGAIWPAAFVAALFAVHPLRVESVAWVAERKDVLSGLFFMLTLAAYTYYARRPWSVIRYLPVPILYACGLMSKPMLVTLPFILFLLDYWPLHRIKSMAGAGFSVPRRLVVEKIPLLLMSAAACVITLLVQKQALQTAAAIPFPLRTSNALMSCTTYLGQLFYPVDLAVFYPYPAAGYAALKISLSLLLLTVISVLVFCWRQKRPYLLVGWLWYLVMLLPVIGLVQVGAQARADRYTYLPEIGLCLALTWAMAQASAGWRNRRIGLGIGASVILFLLVIEARTQTAYWRDSESLWKHTLDCTAHNAVAESNLANDFLRQGRFDEAMAQAKMAIEIEPDYADAHNCLGFALFQTGQFADAISHFQAALKIRPDFASAHNNLGMALLRTGQLDEAASHFQEALRIQPDLADAQNNLGVALLQKGQPEAAVTHYRLAIELKPGYLGAENNLAWVLSTSTNAALRNGTEALQWAQRANQLSPSSDMVVLRTLAAAYAEAGQFPQAMETAGQALSLATAKGNNAWIEALQAEIKLYRAGQPFRDNGLVP